MIRNLTKLCAWLDRVASCVDLTLELVNKYFADPFCYQANGVEGARRQFEKHWNEYCSDADLDWLVSDAKCESKSPFSLHKGSGP